MARIAMGGAPPASLMGGQIMLPNMLLPSAVAAQVSPATQRAPPPVPAAQASAPPSMLPCPETALGIWAGCDCAAVRACGT